MSNQLLRPGTKAPDFQLKATPDQSVALHEFGEKPVILCFYPADFSPVCGDELVIYNQTLPMFSSFNAQLLGISVDNVWCHIAFEKDRNLHFPLLSDFHPKGYVSNIYGVFDELTGESKRALFVIDSKGFIHWSYLSPVGVNPGADGILRALREL